MYYVTDVWINHKNFFYSCKCVMNNIGFCSTTTTKYFAEHEVKDLCTINNVERKHYISDKGSLCPSFETI